MAARRHVPSGTVKTLLAILYIVMKQVVHLATEFGDHPNEQGNPILVHCMYDYFYCGQSDL